MKSAPKSRDTPRWAAALAAVGAALVLAGCGPIRKPPHARPPQVNPEQLLAAHNAWAESIQHVWARADLALNLPADDAGAKRDRYDVGGHFFLAKPDGLFIDGDILGQTVFQFGVGGRTFWLWVKPSVNTVWVGRRGGAAEGRLIISPPALLEALGVFRIDPAAGREMTLEEFGRHAVLSEYASVRGPLVRRLWFNRDTFRPERVDLYEAGGKRLLMGEMLRYERIGGTDVCTDYRIRFFTAGEVDMVVHLKDVSLTKEPNPRIFEYRRPPDAKEVDLDLPRPVAADSP